MLETTASLLNQDLHWSLCNLRASVSRGLNPKQDYCSICLQQYKRRQETADEIIVFSCGHLYHSFCLQSKECTLETEGQTRWTCYKCSSSNKAGKLSENPSESKKGRITSPQVGLASALARAFLVGLLLPACLVRTHKPRFTRWVPSRRSVLKSPFSPLSP